MPPRKTGPAKPATTRKTTANQGGDTEPGRLAESMVAARQAGKTTQAAEEEAAERSRIAARGVTIQKIDEDGAPVGEPQRLAGVAELEFAPDDSGINLAFDEAFDAAPKPEDPSLEFSTSDPVAVATVRDLTRIPIPTAVIAQWFPAYFRPEPGETPWVTCKVFLTPQGLYVYRTAPEAEDVASGAVPAWYAPVDFAKTAKPVTGYAAMNAGIPIFTSSGRQVNVQPFGGCGCSARRLKNWTPSWARNRISWDDAVKLTDTTAGR